MSRRKIKRGGHKCRPRAQDAQNAERVNRLEALASGKRSRKSARIAKKKSRDREEELKKDLKKADLEKLGGSISLDIPDDNGQEVHKKEDASGVSE